MNRWRTMSGLAITTLIAAGIHALPVQAGGKLTEPRQTITIEGKKPAAFNHQSHTAQGIGCGACHHDGDHQPRTAEGIGGLQGVEELRCTSCHNGDFANPKLQKAKDVFHGRCQTCHKEGFNGKKGPTGCTACHETKKKPKAKQIEGC